MGAIMKVNAPDRVVTVALYGCSTKWEHGRLLAGGPVFGAEHMSHFQLDLRYWEVKPGADNTLDCAPREKKPVFLITLDGDRVISQESFGYEKFIQEKQDAYGVFLTDGNTELLSSANYDIHVQTVQDYTQGRSVTAIIATKKDGKNS